jgi:hypothetical protein
MVQLVVSSRRHAAHTSSVGSDGATRSSWIVVTCTGSPVSSASSIAASLPATAGSAIHRLRPASSAVRAPGSRAAAGLA